jgi:superfamily II DNA or RNA helicase
MPFDLTIDDIRAAVPARYFQRGLTYQRQRRVLELEWDEATKTLYSEVKGSGRRIYEQDIWVDDEDAILVNRCSCPLGGSCKHIVAVLLEWVARNPQGAKTSRRGQPDELAQWQRITHDRLQEEGINPYPEPGQGCLLYLLVPKVQAGQQTVEVQTLKSRRLKRGGWGKTSTFNLADLNSYSSYGAAANALPQDREIARLLADQFDYAGRKAQLRGDVGVLVLQRLLRSGRCFLRSTDKPPLTLGPPRKLAIAWQKGAQTTRCQLLLDETDDDWRIAPTEPAWYLDPAVAQCGPIEAQPCASTLLAALAVLPELPEEKLPELSYFLSDTLPPDSIPLPVELDLIRLEGPPVPSLILHGVLDPEGTRRHLVRLRFGYGPFSLPPFAAGDAMQQLRRHESQDYRIRRDREAESEAFAQLQGMLLEPAGPPLHDPEELELLFTSTSLADSARRWRDLLDQLPTLEEAGWRIEIDPSFSLQFETAQSLLADIEEQEAGWFDLGLKIDYQGSQIDLLPLLLQWLEAADTERPLMHPLGESRWLEVPAAVLAPVVETLVELFQDPQLDSAGRLKLPRAQAHNLLEIEQRLEQDGHQLHWQGGQGIRQVAEKLLNFEGIEQVDAPGGLNAALRPYQQQGLSWLQFLREYDFNGILADDMGLGKTIQLLSHLLLEKEAGRLTQAALVVAPTSVLSNWRHEAERFAPALRCLVLHGPDREPLFDQLGDVDLVITSYALLQRDLKRHLSRSYHSLILDEAQAIKNPQAKSAQAARRINARHRLCLTGTPLENHLGELWSLFHFLMPGYLGSQRQFNKLFRTPIERHADAERQHRLQQRLAPFVLRRNKEQVALELPTKTVMIREAEFGTAQAKLYESLRLAMVNKVSRLLQKKGLQKSHIEILDALLKLRQACCDPRLLKLEAAARLRSSAKLDELFDLLAKLLDEERKVLIFSQFTSMLSLIETELAHREIHYTKLTGQTRKRERAIAAFQEGPARVFLISLKAGGVGLNLTAADTVIHYDPWWNPAVENQATDRAHRIGQDKPVFVYKLVVKGTIEERILQMQEKKQRIADGIHADEAGEQPLAALTSEEILSLLGPVDS